VGGLGNGPRLAKDEGKDMVKEALRIFCGSIREMKKEN
jgi:hypothetical protein